MRVRWVQRGAAVPALTPVADPGSSDGLQDRSVGRGGRGAGRDQHFRDADRRRRAAAVPFGSHRSVPALYAAKVTGLVPGRLSVLSLTSSGSSALSATGEVSVPYASELSPNPALTSPLGELVRQTGGRIVGAARSGQPARARTRSRQAPDPGRPDLLLRRGGGASAARSLRQVAGQRRARVHRPAAAFTSVAERA